MTQPKWRVGKGPHNKGDIYAKDYRLAQCDTVFIADEIVREHNAHDAMREALELIVDVYNKGGIPVEEHFGRIKAALTLAKGE